MPRPIPVTHRLVQRRPTGVMVPGSPVVGTVGGLAEPKCHAPEALILASAALLVFACASYSTLMGGIVGAAAAGASAILALQKLLDRLDGSNEPHGDGASE
jgi:hypothetical protein